MTSYQIVGDCAHVTTMTAGGRARVLLYKPAMVPGDVPAAEIKHLLSVGLIEEVGKVAEQPRSDEPEPATAKVVDPDQPAHVVSEVVTGGGDPVDGEDADGDSGSDGADGDTNDGDDAVGAEPPADGSAPPQNASKAAWVEYAVSQGMDRDEANKASKKDLIDTLKRP